MKNITVLKVTFKCGHSKFYRLGDYAKLTTKGKTETLSYGDLWKATRTKDGTFVSKSDCAECRQRALVVTPREDGTAGLVGK